MAVISFYSYKGGSGRTTTTLNTLYYLIQETKPKSSSPLIIIDADNESYGMSMLIRDTDKYCSPDVSLQGLGVLRAIRFWAAETRAIGAHMKSSINSLSPWATISRTI